MVVVCSSYGLDSRFDPEAWQSVIDARLLEQLCARAAGAAPAATRTETLRPTGIGLRNLNPLFCADESGKRLELLDAWWGYLVDGKPATFPSLNTRSERLRTAPGVMKQRGIIPASTWFEKRKTDGGWFEFRDGDQLLGIAAVVRPGRLPDGTEFTCYSMVMQPSPERLASIHDRMPLVLPSSFASTWLDQREAPSAELIDAALDAGAELRSRIHAKALASSPLAPPPPPTLFE